MIHCSPALASKRNRSASVELAGGGSMRPVATPGTASGVAVAGRSFGSTSATRGN